MARRDGVDAPVSTRASLTPHATTRVACRSDANAKALRGLGPMPLPLRAAKATRGVSSRAQRVVVSASSDAALVAAPAPKQGIKWGAAIISIAVGLVVNYLVPCPVGVTQQAWQLLSIFLATVTGECSLHLLLSASRRTVSQLPHTRGKARSVLGASWRWASPRPRDLRGGDALLPHLWKNRNPKPNPVLREGCGGGGSGASQDGSAGRRVGGVPLRGHLTSCGSN